MVLLNFSHPLKPEHLDTLQQNVDVAVEHVHRVPCQLDEARPYEAQVRALVEAIPLSGEAWQTTPLLVNPPGHGAIATLVLAELHGRCGYFPAILRWRRATDGVATQWEPAEVINLQSVRETARTRRSIREGSVSDGSSP